MKQEDDLNFGKKVFFLRDFYAMGLHRNRFHFSDPFADFISHSKKMALIFIPWFDFPETRPK